LWPFVLTHQTLNKQYTFALLKMITKTTKHLPRHRADFEIGDMSIPAGSRRVIELELPKLSSQNHLSIPVHVIHGRQEGPTLFLSAAIHGDELNGVEIIRSVLAKKILGKLKGTLVAVPVVNAYGLIQESRYLPDRRDLNRSFPGSETGSLASRLAHLFMREIVMRSTIGIDLHTGSNHRTNLPQIRANLDDPETERLARSFGVPVLLNASLRDGSLRASACEQGVPILLYEAGEALRFNEVSIRAGVAGIFNVMRATNMLPPPRRISSHQREPFVARSSRWIRAPESGMLKTAVRLGAKVNRKDILGYEDDPSGGPRSSIRAKSEGIVIGRLELPIVHEGDAVYHIAQFSDDDVDEVVDHVEDFQLGHGEDT